MALDLPQGEARQCRGKTGLGFGRWNLPLAFSRCVKSLGFDEPWFYPLCHLSDGDGICWRSDSRHQQRSFLLIPLSLACRWLPSLPAPTCFLLFA